MANKIRYRKLITPLMLAALLLCMSAAAVAEGPAEAVSGKGRITASETINLLAPMGGQLKDFSWQIGDRAEADMLALEILPARVCAPNDGVIVGLNVQAGDQADAVQAQYGALCYVERQGVWHIKASTDSAYNKPRNRDIRIGDVLRVREGNGDKTGAGRVISTEGKTFVLEMEQGDFKLEDDVSIYYGTGTTYKNSECMGKGKVARPSALSVKGSGIVACALVKEGDTVQRGQPLFLLDSSAARYENQAGSPQVLFPHASMIEKILVSPGQTVAQGQMLMTLIPEGDLEATLEIDELDIAQVRVGQKVQLKIDAYPYAERSGRVIEICPIGNTQLDTTKYNVRVIIDQTQGLLIGMHVTGCLK